MDIIKRIIGKKDLQNEYFICVFIQGVSDKSSLIMMVDFWYICLGRIRI